MGDLRTSTFCDLKSDKKDDNFSDNKSKLNSFKNDNIRGTDPGAKKSSNADINRTAS